MMYDPMSSVSFPTIWWMTFACVLSETYTNPGANTNISCGIDGPCTIICDTPNACESTQFYLYSNDAIVRCSEYASCRFANIISVNSTSLTLYFRERSSFESGTAFIQQSNQHITTYCDEELGLFLLPN